MVKAPVSSEAFNGSMPSNNGNPSHTSSTGAFAQVGLKPSIPWHGLKPSARENASAKTGVDDGEKNGDNDGVDNGEDKGVYNIVNDGADNVVNDIVNGRVDKV